MPEDLTSLRFKSKMEPYHPGELAGFPLERAQRIVAAGIAVYVDPPAGLDETGEPIMEDEEKKESAVKSKPKTTGRGRKKKEPEDGIESRKSGKLGTVKK
jgi:hypothetical protein